MVDGIILAGGYSSRTKQNKMTLKLDGKELILHTISRMKSVCDRIICVTGHYHDEIKKLLENDESVTIVKNANYENGMFSSVLTGVGHVDNSFFIIPGDCPFVEPSTYEKILKGNKKIRVPSYMRHLGHPVYIDIGLKKELLEGKYANLKEFRNAHDFEYIDVDDKNILIDIDTLKDYKTLEEGNDLVGN